MRTLALNKQAENKVGDTATTWYFTLSDDGNAVSTVGDTLTAHIKNSTGYLIDVPVTSTNNGLAQVSFNNKAIEQLPSGEYLLEIDLVNTDGTVAKYPTDGFFPFQLNLNAMSTTGELVPEITFQNVLDSVGEKIKTELATGDYKGPKGDNAYLHVAYANSADGSTDFSRQGNENLLTNSGTFQNTWTCSVGSADSSNPAIYHYAGTADSFIDFLAQSNLAGLSSINQTYTLGFWAKGTGILSTYVFPNVGVDGSDNHHTWSLTSDWQYFTQNFDTLASNTDMGNKSLLFRNYKYDNNSGSLDAYITKPKMEVGSTATDWCPAPADNKPYHYMGTYTDTTATGSTNPSDYTWSAILGPQGPSGKDAVINVVTQAAYDALTDKTGLYVIQG